MNVHMVSTCTNHRGILQFHVNVNILSMHDRVIILSNSTWMYGWYLYIYIYIYRMDTILTTCTWMNGCYLYLTGMQYSPRPRECMDAIYTLQGYDTRHFHMNVHILSIHHHDTILSTSTWMYTSYLYITMIQYSPLPRECTHPIYTSTWYNALHFHVNVHILSIHHHDTILSTSTWMYTSYLYITMIQYSPLPHECTHPIYTSTRYNTLHFHMNVHILSIHQHDTILSTSTWMYTSYLYITMIKYSPLPHECTHPIYTWIWYNTLYFHMNIHILSIHHNDTILSTSASMYTSYLYINLIQYSPLPRECTHPIYTSQR